MLEALGPADMVLTGPHLEAVAQVELRPDTVVVTWPTWHQLRLDQLRPGAAVTIAPFNEGRAIVRPYVDIDPVGDQAPGAVAVTGGIDPSAPVEAAPLIAGVPGTYTPMTTTETRWSGNVTMDPGGAVQVRVRVVGQALNWHDSEPFTVSDPGGAAGLMALQPVPLISGAYQARSVLAGAQRALNLYPEQSPKDAPFPFVNYPTPGLRLLATTALGAWRMLYMASSGDLYGVVGSTVVWIDADNGWTINSIGTITAGITTPCSMTDNNNMGLLVDGTPTGGWYIDLATRAMTQVNPTDNSSVTGGYGFVGADRVQSIDTYIVLNAPGTQQFYSTDPATIAFDPFWFGAKSGYNDNLMTIAVTRREVWLIGRVTTEIWFDAGETSSGGIALFPFQIMPGPFVEHGTPAKYSVATIAGVVFFLGRSNVGEPGAYVGERYEVRNISTHAMEYEWSTYGDVSDAIGFCYEQQGHGFYVLTFPSADKTWVYDMATQLWHERGWADAEGQPHRHRAQVHAFARTTNVVGDWENGNLYALDPTVYTDDGAPIVRIRSWPRLNIGSKRVMYRQFVADMEVGTAGATTSFPPPPRVKTDDSLACRGIPDDPLKVAIVDGTLPATPIPLPPGLPGDGTVSTDDTLTGSGAGAAPLSVIWVDGAVPRQGGANGTLPWVATDDTLAGDGSPGAPLSVDLVDGRRQITCSATLISEPVVRLRWSDDKGQSWSNPVSQPFGSAGEYRASVQWQRLGMARDRVFELTWSAPVRTALSGAWVDSKEGVS